MKEKKKFGLILWSVLLVVAVALTTVGFIFGFTQLGVSVFTKVLDNNSFIIANNADFVTPITQGFATILRPGTDAFIFTVVVLAAALIGLITILALAISRKRYGNIAHVLPLLVCVFLLMYAGYAVGIPMNGHVAGKELIAKAGPLYVVLLAKEGFNWVQRIFGWIFVVGLASLVTTVIGYFVIVCMRTAERKPVEAKAEAAEEKSAVANEVAPVATATVAPTIMPSVESPAVAHEDEAEAPKAKKKVFLIVKKYNATAEKVTEVEEEKPAAEPITLDAVREVLKAELDARELQKAKEESANKGNSVICAPNAPVNETRCVSTPATKAEEKKPSTPIIICIPQPVVDADEKPVEPKEEKPAISREDIRNIIRDELAKTIRDYISVPATEEIVEETVEEVVEEPEVKPEENETIAVLNEDNVAVDVKEETPAPVVKEVKEEKVVAPVVEEPLPEPEAKPEPVVEAPVAEPAPEVAAAPVERLSFADRLKDADDEMKDNYNHIKSLLMSYGLKSRVSNGGDAFRLHKVTYAKVCVAGKSLKIYLALDPQDYKNSTFPVKDASSKAIYKEIPLVFKVKSGLSMRRCEQLIGEMMDKHGVEQVDRVELKDYISLLDSEETEEE